MQRFKSPGQAQSFLEPFSAVCNHFRAVAICCPPGVTEPSWLNAFAVGERSLLACLQAKVSYSAHIQSRVLSCGAPGTGVAVAAAAGVLVGVAVCLA